jgi:flagellar basal-body rod modification protein FlgD
MSQIPSIGTSTDQATAGADQNQSLRGLNMDHFLELMITELQNQDPLDPLDNAQILQQISQIREIGATDSLNNTLEAVLLSQNVSSATSLIGKQVSGLTDAGESVEGKVDRVTIADGTPTVHVDGVELKLTNIREIVEAEDKDAEASDV